MPTSIGYQDLASLIVRESSIASRWQAQLVATPISAVHAASFGFSRSTLSALPPPTGYTLASVGPDTGFGASLLQRMLGERDPEAEAATAAVQFPAIERRLKGDRLAAPKIEDDDEDTADTTVAPEEDGESTVASAPAGESDETSLWEEELHYKPDPAADEAAGESAEPNWPDTPLGQIGDLGPSVSDAELYFGGQPLGLTLAAIEPWEQGETPIVQAPPSAAEPVIIRLAALPPKADASQVPAGTGQTVANKGEVTTVAPKFKSPAERLRLNAKTRAQAEKCLANAVYFESRSEEVRGQIAVAQVVMNRVFSPFYPKTVCSVVYQNANRRLACQFTFACDGIPDVVTEPEAWERAMTIAKETLDGKLWLDDIGKATHYHASYVRPYWVREMRKMYRFGLHTFYRPRRWGNGGDEPRWGDAAATTAAVKNL